MTPEEALAKLESILTSGAPRERLCHCGTLHESLDTAIRAFAASHESDCPVWHCTVLQMQIMLTAMTGGMSVDDLVAVEKEVTLFLLHEKDVVSAKMNEVLNASRDA